MTSFFLRGGGEISLDFDLNTESSSSSDISYDACEDCLFKMIVYYIGIFFRIVVDILQELFTLSFNMLFIPSTQYNVSLSNNFEQTYLFQRILEPWSTLTKFENILNRT